MNRATRHARILELVRTRQLSTQQEVAAALAADGHRVAQTTVSRDIGELKLVKVRAGDGRLVYTAPGAVDHRDRDRLADALRRWGMRIEASGNLAVVFTLPGYASALARELDEARHPSVLATVAGDDTVLVVAREGSTGEDLRTELTRVRERGERPDHD